MSWARPSLCRFSLKVRSTAQSVRLLLYRNTNTTHLDIDCSRGRTGRGDAPIPDSSRKHLLNGTQATQHCGITCTAARMYCMCALSQPPARFRLHSPLTLLTHCKLAARLPLCESSSLPPPYQPHPCSVLLVLLSSSTSLPVPPSAAASLLASACSCCRTPSHTASVASTPSVCPEFYSCGPPQTL